MRFVHYLLLSALLVACASKGDQLMKAGYWEEAVNAYQEALREDPFSSVLQPKLAAARSRAAAIHADQGRAMLKEGNSVGAIEELKRALFLDPTNADYHAVLTEVLRYKEGEDFLNAGQRLLKVGRMDEAAEAFQQALGRDPDLKAAQEGLIKIAERQRAGRNMIFANASKQPITLQFQNARTKEVFEVLARAGNINFMFDKDLRDDPVTIYLKDGTFEEALNLILTTQNLFMRRVSTDTILIVPKSKQKLDQYQDLLIRTFYISNGKAKDLVNLLRTMLESKRVYVNEDLNAVVIRDSPDKVKLAERIIYANDRKPGEVMFEIEVLEVDKTKTDRFGVNIAKQAGAAVVPASEAAPTFPGANTVLFTWKQLRSLNPTSYLFTLPTSILVDFLRNESNAKTLANPKIRVVNNKQAKINIGDKVPILLSTTNTTPGVVGGTVPTQSTITSIEFKDVGVKLSVEPTIHLSSEVTLKLQLEVTRLGDQITLQSNPLIQQFKFGTRTAETVLTLKDGESVVLGGLLQDEDRTTVSKVPGFGDIPVMGWLFKSTTHDTVQTDVILTITPRIIRGLEPPGIDEQSFWSGTEDTYSVKPLFDTGRGIDISDAPSSSITPARQSQRLRRGRLSPVPGTSKPPAAPPVLPDQGALAPPLPTDPLVPGDDLPPLQSMVTPRLQASAALGPTVPETPTTASPRVPAASAPKPPGNAPAGALKTVLMSIRPSDGIALRGLETRVDILAANAVDLMESTITLRYDPKVLEFRQALDGEFLNRDGSAGMVVDSNPVAGTVTLKLKRARGSKGVSGDGVLATIAFAGKTVGVSPLVIRSVKLLNQARAVLPASGWQATLSVQ